MKLTVYIYADLLKGRVKETTCNYWTTDKEVETGIYKSEYACNKFLTSHTFEVEDVKFDFVPGKIQALELQLGDLHVKSENIKAQIQELKCIGHESEERMKDKVLGDEDHFDQDTHF